MLNRLPKYIRTLSYCSVVGLKSQLDSYLRNIVDLPCRPRFTNSLDDGLAYKVVTTLMTWRPMQDQLELQTWIQVCQARVVMV